MPTIPVFVDGVILTAADLNALGTALNNAIGSGTTISGYTTGDILYASAANTLSKLSIGTAGQALLVTGGVPAWGSAAASGGYRSVGQVSRNNSGTPNTQFDLNADFVVLKNASNQLVVRAAPGILTNNVSTAGSTAGGRDQAGVFSATSWIYFYWIWDGATLSTLSSAVAPPTGPTLPTGYTHWCPSCAVYFDGSSHLLLVDALGPVVRYQGQQTAFNTTSGTTENTVSVSALVPPAASRYMLSYNVAALATTETLNIGPRTTVYPFQWGPTGVSSAPAGEVTLQNVGQQFFFRTPGSSRVCRFDVTAYALPYGGE